VNRLVSAGLQMVEKSYYLNYGRDIIAGWCKEYFVKLGAEEIKVLDIGCGMGDDLYNIKTVLPHGNLELCGIECHPPYIAQARQKGVNVLEFDIEKQTWPVADEYYDIVIANQILEHTKEIFWILSEISRTLKKGGRLILGVPNLLSLHNRLTMMCGGHPISIELLGPHVRGFTAPAVRRLIEADGYFKILQMRASNFYPFPPPISKVLSRILPTFSVCLFFLAERQMKKGEFIHVLDSRFYETPFYRGNQASSIGPDTTV